MSVGLFAIDDLYEDFRDGFKLLTLLEILSGTPLVSLPINLEFFSRIFFLDLTCRAIKTGGALGMS